jgi:hypothetical protein
MHFTSAVYWCCPLLSRPAVADEINKKTVFQFHAPVEIPGRVLAPGKYVFRIADTSDLNIVQVYSEDVNGHDSLIDSIAATPEHMENTPKMPVINYEEQPGHPRAVAAGLPPGTTGAGSSAIQKTKSNMRVKARLIPKKSAASIRTMNGRRRRLFPNSSSEPPTLRWSTFSALSGCPRLQTG